MLNEYEKAKALNQVNAMAGRGGLQGAIGNAIGDQACGREMTVGEILDRRIEKAERLVRALLDLKSSLPASYLHSGASRIAAFLEALNNG